MTLTGLMVSEDENKEDAVIWEEEASSMFTVSKEYEKLRASNSKAKWPGWNRIWKLKIQKRVKTFIWLLAHDSLITNQIRWKRRLAENPLVR